MKFAKTYGIQCLAHEFTESMHGAFEVSHDTDTTSCPDCDRKIDLTMFRMANRTAIIAYEMAERFNIDRFSFSHPYQSGDDDTCPAQMVFERCADLLSLDLRICTLHARWQEAYIIRLTTKPNFGSPKDWLMDDVFKHPLLSTCGEESPPLGSLAPMIAALNIWNTACELARHDDWLVFPRLDNLEIWHAPIDK